MSDQRDESSGTTTLEDVFLSREFQRSQRGAASGPEETPDVVSARQAIITVRFGSAHHVPDPLLSSGSDEAVGGKELEGVLLSAQLGQPLTLVPPLEPAGATPAGERVVVAFPSTAPRDNRYRTVAAVSGIAAAALVVAGISTGAGHPRSSDVAALGRRPTAQLRGGLTSPGGVPTGSPAPGAGAPSAVLASSNGSGSPASSLQDATSQSADAPSSAGAVSGSPGTTVTAVPPPAVPASTPTGSGGGTGIGSSTPAPTPPATVDPLAPIVTVLGSSITGVGTSVTSAARQLASSMPATATVVDAVGTGGGTVSELGRALSSTTA